MFFETPSPTYFAPAAYRMFGADGEILERKVDLHLKRLKASEHKALDLGVQELRKVLDPNPYKPLLAAVLVGWRVQDGKEVKTIAFTQAVLDEMEESFPGFTFACAVGYYASIAPAEAAHHVAKN